MPDGSNVIPFSRAPRTYKEPEAMPEAPPIIIPLDNVELAERALSQAQTGLELARRVLTMEVASKYGDEELLSGVGEVLSTLSRMLDRMQAAPGD